MKLGALLLGLVGLTGCYKPGFENCELACASGDLCPSGLRCDQGHCTSGSGCGDVPGADGALVGACNDQQVSTGELCYDANVITQHSTLAAADATLVDMNGDGRRDLTYATVGGVAWFTQNPAGGLDGAGSLSPSTSGTALGVADLIAGGSEELVLADAGVLRVHMQTGMPVTASITVTPSARVVGVAGVHLPGPLAVALFVDNLAAAVFDGTANFSGGVKTVAFASAVGLAAGRINAGDLMESLLVADSMGIWTVTLSAGALSKRPLLALAGLRSIALADLDGDGDLDLVYTRANTLAYRVNTAGNFGLENARDLTSIAPPIAVADVNHDGRDDLAVTVIDAGASLQLVGLDGDAFTVLKTIPLQFDPVALHAGDFSGSGGADFTLTSDHKSGMTTLALVRSNN